MKAEELEGAIEAILFLATEPVSLESLHKALNGEITIEKIEEIIEKIAKKFEDNSHGIRLRKVASGYQFTTRAEYSKFIKNYFKEQKAKKLSKASLEVLAIVAYRQPITSAEISAIRGIESQHVIKGLLEKKLIKICGRKNVVGKPLLYSTTKEFLIHFGLNSLDDLPTLEELNDVFNEGIKQETLFKETNTNSSNNSEMVQ